MVNSTLKYEGGILQKKGYDYDLNTLNGTGYFLSTILHTVRDAPGIYTDPPK